MKFYIQSIRLEHNSPIVVDWTVVEAEELAAVKRQARLKADIADAREWVWPLAQAIRVIDAGGTERFRCWCRVPLTRQAKARVPNSHDKIRSPLPYYGKGAI